MGSLQQMMLRKTPKSGNSSLGSLELLFCQVCGDLGCLIGTGQVWKVWLKTVKEARWRSRPREGLQRAGEAFDQAEKFLMLDLNLPNRVAAETR